MINKRVFILFLILMIYVRIESLNTSIVLMHGINSNCSSMNYLKNLIQQNFSDRFVFNVDVGDGRKTSIFTPMFNQIEIFNQQIQ
jgi:hypothetical protein